jgi:transcriptional regulator with XRE-family HTH domain
MAKDAAPLSWWDTTGGPTVGVRLDIPYVLDEMRKQVLSQSDLAARAIRDDGKALSKQMVSDLLKGRRAASPATVRALARALDVLPRKLLCDVVTAPQSASVRAQHAGPTAVPA